MTTREDLILEHRGFAKATVLKLVASLGWSARRRSEELDELLQAGELGLVEAATSFDDTRGAVFTTFAYHRIRGAALDHLRKSGDMTPRRRRAIAEARAANRVAMDTSDTLGAIDAHPVSAKDRRSLLSSLFADTAGALATSVMLARQAEWLNVREAADNPCEAAIDRDLSAALDAATAMLPAEHQDVIRMYYREGKSMSEIGAHFHRDKASISRWHDAALRTLRERIGSDAAIDRSASRYRHAALTRVHPVAVQFARREKP